MLGWGGGWAGRGGRGRGGAGAPPPSRIKGALPVAAPRGRRRVDRPTHYVLFAPPARPPHAARRCRPRPGSSDALATYPCWTLYRFVCTAGVGGGAPSESAPLSVSHRWAGGLALRRKSGGPARGGCRACEWRVVEGFGDVRPLLGGGAREGISRIVSQSRRRREAYKKRAGRRSAAGRPLPPHHPPPSTAKAAPECRPFSALKTQLPLLCLWAGKPSALSPQAVVPLSSPPFPP